MTTPASYLEAGLAVVKEGGKIAIFYFLFSCLIKKLKRMRTSEEVLMNIMYSGGLLWERYIRCFSALKIAAVDCCLAFSEMVEHFGWGCFVWPELPSGYCTTTTASLVPPKRSIWEHWRLLFITWCLVDNGENILLELKPKHWLGSEKSVKWPRVNDSEELPREICCCGMGALSAEKCNE